MVLILLTGGMPIRATELTSLKHSNGFNTLRNLFLINDVVCALAEYSKTQAVTGQPKCIARFLCVPLSRLYIAYVVYALPFAELLRFNTEAPDPAPSLPTALPSNYLFHDGGVPWDTQRVSDVLGRESQKGIRCRLTISSWRHVAIAIDQELLQGRSSTFLDSTEGALHALQAGHSEETENGHYSLRIDMLKGTSQRTLDAFHSVSTGWHRLFHLATTSPRSPGSYKRLKRRCSCGGEPVDEVELAGGATAPPLERMIPDAPPPLKRLRPDGVRLPSPGTPTPAPRPAPGIPQPPRSAAAPDIHGALRTMFGSGATFRSPQQDQAVTAVVSSSDDVIIILPTAGGKSLAILIPTYLQRHLVTIVVVPYVALRDDLIRRSQQVGLQSLPWSPGELAHQPLVFVTPEMALRAEFRAYYGGLVTAGRVARVIFDECHTLTLDVNWRPAMAQMDWFAGHGIQRVFLSATLPASSEKDLRDEMKLASHRTAVVRASTMRHNITYHVQVVPPVKMITTLEKILTEQRERRQKTLVFVCSHSDLADLARHFSTTGFSAELPTADRQMLQDAFCDGQTDLMIATTAFGTGIDIGNVTVVVHYGHCFDIEQLQQQACRGARRPGETARSTLLISPAAHAKLATEGASGPEGRKVLGKYVVTQGCRLQVLSAYFDGDPGRPCSELTPEHALCDNCCQSLASAADATFDVVEPLVRPNDGDPAGTASSGPSSWSPSDGSRSSCDQSGTCRSSCSGGEGSKLGGRSRDERECIASPRTLQRSCDRVHPGDLPAGLPSSCTHVSDSQSGLGSPLSPVADHSRPAFEADRHLGSWQPSSSVTNREQSTSTSLAFHRASPTATRSPKPSFNRDVCRRLFNAVQAIRSHSCYYCWLHQPFPSGESGFSTPTAKTNHSTFKCPRNPLTERECGAIASLIRERRKLPWGIHFSCFLPIQEFHPEKRSWGEVCPIFADIVVPIVLLATAVPAFSALLSRLGLTERFWTRPIEEIVPILDASIDSPVHCTLLHAFRMIALARCP